MHYKWTEVCFLGRLVRSDLLRMKNLLKARGSYLATGCGDSPPPTHTHPVGKIGKGGGEKEKGKREGMKRKERKNGGIYKNREVSDKGGSAF